MLKHVLKWLGAIIAVVVIAIAVFLTNLIWFRPWSLNLFYEKVFAEILFDHPEILSTLGLVEQFGLTSHNGKLDDESPAHQQREFDRWKRDVAQLRQYPLDRQSASQKLSTHVLDWFLGMQAEGEKWQWHNYPVNQLFGVQNQFPSFMANTHRLLNRKDCDYYVMRLDALPKKFDQLLDGLKIREQKQILPPRFVVEEVLKEMTGFIGKPASENILATSFKTRAAKIDKLTEADRADFQARVEAAITTKVYPTYQKLIGYLQEILPKTTTDDGVWKLPDGDAYYAYQLHENTITSLKPNEVHELGLREVARIESEMRAILDANGFAGQPIGEAMDSWEKTHVFFTQTMTKVAPTPWRNTRS
jgi:uncharacterized protein (DUF885 family)